MSVPHTYMQTWRYTHTHAYTWRVLKSPFPGSILTVRVAFGKESHLPERGRTNWGFHSFPPTLENVNRLYPCPQLGLPFPFHLTCTSHGWLWQDLRWRRTNTGSGKKEEGGKNGGARAGWLSGAGGPGPSSELWAPLRSDCQPMTRVWKTHHQEPSQGLRETWVATNTKSPNKWLYMMWSLSALLGSETRGLGWVKNTWGARLALSWWKIQLEVTQ